MEKEGKKSVKKNHKILRVSDFSAIIADFFSELFCRFSKKSDFSMAGE